MASKNNIDLSNFDFGFSVVDEDELAVVQSVKSEVFFDKFSKEFIKSS